MTAGMRQKRAYDLYARWLHFGVGELIWVYCPVLEERTLPQVWKATLDHAQYWRSWGLCFECSYSHKEHKFSFYILQNENLCS